mgnify:CR=1 FL=1
MPRSIELLTGACQALFTKQSLASATMEVPERVLHLLHELDCDQVQLGKAMGTTKSVVNQWLAGTIKSIAPIYAFTLQRNHGYLVEWTLLGTGPEKAPKDELEVIEQYRKMKPHERQKWRLLWSVAKDGAPDAVVAQTIKPAPSNKPKAKKPPARPQRNPQKRSGIPGS